MNKFILYEHVSPNGKRYIGITSKKANKRWERGSGYKTNTYFYNAIQKYGWDNFEHNILKTDLSKEEACKLEREYISKYKSNQFQYGYNRSMGGEMEVGWHYNEEQKVKISEATKKAMQDPEIRKKCSKGRLGKPAYNKGKHISEETKEKLRQVNLGNKNPNYGKKRKPLTNEQKQKIRESVKKAMNTLEVKKKISEGVKKSKEGKIQYNKGKKTSKEIKEKISESTKKAMQDPEIRERFLQANREACKRRKERNRLNKEMI